MANFMDRLKQLRIANNMTQKELANVLNVTQTAINYWENGKREPNTSTLEKMADFFGVSRAYLMGWDDNTDMILYYDSFIPKEWIEDESYKPILDLLREEHKINSESDETIYLLTKDTYSQVYQNLLLSSFNKLNEAGKQKAIEDVENLTYNPKYKK